MSSYEVATIGPRAKASSVIAELITEIEQFVQTRTELFKAEVREEVPHLRNATVLAVAGGILLVSGYLFIASCRSANRVSFSG